MGTPAHPHDNDMPSEIDFSNGTRGKFHRPSTGVGLPLYLDDELRAALQAIAPARRIELSTLVDELLSTHIERFSAHVDEFFAAVDRMAAVDEPPTMSAEALAAETEAMRAALSRSQSVISKVDDEPRHDHEEDRPVRGRQGGGPPMNVIVIRHVPVAELPQAWRKRLGQAAGAKVTVRIEAEDQGAAVAAEPFHTDDPAFGIWRDRDDMDDVAAPEHRPPGRGKP